MANLFKRDSGNYLKEIEELSKLKKRGTSLVGTDYKTFTQRALQGEKITNPYGDSTASPLNTQYGLGNNTMGIAQEGLGIDGQPIPESSMTMSFKDFSSNLKKDSLPKVVGTVDDGGYVLDSGQVVYGDGTFRDSMDSDRVSVPEMVYFDDKSGMGFYSDGVVRGATTVNGSIVGIGELIQDLFGEQKIVTQEYGNYNPALGYKDGTHAGIDVGTGEDVLTLPFDGEVVQVYRSQYDGARLGDFSEANGYGYGNSVLVRDPNGNLLRFSHLSQLNANVGDVIKAGTQFGVTGTTGNSTGEHLDVEYIDAAGNKRNPREYDFKGEINVGQPKEDLENREKLINRSIQGEISNGTTDFNDEVINNIVKHAEATVDIANDPTKDVTEQDKAILDIANRDVNMPSQTIATAGVVTNLPERGVSEVVSGEITPQAATNLRAVDVLKNTDDKGLSGLVKSGIGAGELAVGNIKGAVKELASTSFNKVIDKISSRYLPEDMTGLASTLARKALPENVQKNIYDTDIRNDAQFAEDNKGLIERMGIQSQMAINEPLGVPSVGESGASTSRTAGEILDEAASTSRPVEVKAEESINSGDSYDNPQNDLQRRLSQMRSEGKNEANDKTFAKLAGRYESLKKSTPKDQWGSFTSTGYLNKAADKAKQAERAVKQSYYDSGIDVGSFNKFQEKVKSGELFKNSALMQKFGSAQGGLQDAIAPLIPNSFYDTVNKITSKYNMAKQGVKDAGKYVAGNVDATYQLATDSGARKGLQEELSKYTVPGSGAYKVAEKAAKVQKGIQNAGNLFKRTKANVKSLFRR